MDHELSAEETRLVETARVFAIEKIAPFAAEWDLNRTVPYAVFREAAAVGLTGVLAPKSIGGQGAQFPGGRQGVGRIGRSVLCLYLWPMGSQQHAQYHCA